MAGKNTSLMNLVRIPPRGSWSEYRSIRSAKAEAGSRHAAKATSNKCLAWCMAMISRKVRVGMAGLGARNLKIGAGAEGLTVYERSFSF